MSDPYFNTECPICFSDETNDGNGEGFTFSATNVAFHLMSCLHRIHLECAKGLNSFECPICRKNVNNFPDYIKSAIEINSKNRAEAVELEDRQNLQRIVEEEYRHAPPRATIEQEILSALQYVRNFAIPLRFIPVKILVTVFKDTPPPPEGVVFCTIVDYISKNILRILSLEEKTPNDVFSEEDEDTNPFEEDDKNSKNIKRVIKIHDLNSF